MVEIELDDNLESIIIFAERHVLGRKSYDVSIFTDYVRSMIPLLSTKTLSALDADIRGKKSEVERTGIKGLWGDGCDERDWLRLWNAIKIELANRKGVSDG